MTVLCWLGRTNTTNYNFNIVFSAPCKWILLWSSKETDIPY